MHLELIMTDKKLTADDARAFLSDHLEGALDDDTRQEIDALLASDAALAAERRRLESTVSLLKGLGRPEPPGDIVGKVRDRLAAERRAQSADAFVAADAASAATPLFGAPHPAGGFRHWGALQAAVAFAAVAGVAVFIAVAGHGPSSGGPTGVGAAGLPAEDHAAVSATLVAPGIPHIVVVDLAAKAGMDMMNGNVFEGDRRAAGRFIIALKGAAAERGVSVSGFIPDAARVRIEVKSE